MRRPGLRRFAPWVLAAAILVGAALLAGPGDGDGVPFDPSGSGPLGTKALAETLRVVGAQVATDDVVTSGTDTVLLARDRYDEALRDRLREWVADGGTLVLTDPRSSLNPVPPTSVTAFGLVGDVGLGAHCDETFVRGVDEVVAPNWTSLRAGERGAAACIPVEDGHGLVVVERGRGAIVVLGAPGIVTNVHLGKADNAVLLVNLLAPRGEERVTVLGLPPPGAGEASLVQLVPAGVWAALAQVGLAFVVLAAMRARRLGAPVEERLATVVPGSELIRAAGRLLERNHLHDAAAATLGDALRREAARRLGMTPGAGPEAIAQALERVGTGERVTLLEVLRPGPIEDDAALVEYARAVEDVRSRIRHGAAVPVRRRSETFP